MLEEMATGDGSLELDFGVHKVGEDLDAGAVRGSARGISSLSEPDSRARGSRASYSLKSHMSESDTKTFFSGKPGAFKAALDKCCSSVLMTDLDGRPLDAWLLTEIDHWNFEMERMVVLTENSFITVKYDFIQQTAKDVNRIALHNIRKLQIGDLTYPKRSIMQRRDCGGIRIHYGGEENPPSIMQRWNPWSRKILFSTFMHHPLIYQKDVGQMVDRFVYNIDLMAEALKAAVEDSLRRSPVKGKELTVDESPIVIESFAGFPSAVFNQSRIGFFKDRGQINF